MTFKVFDLTGKTALVTGSSQGIGYGLADGLAKAGAKVILNGRDPAKLEIARKELAAKYKGISASAFDVTDEKGVTTTIAAIEAQQPIDILINNAGMQFRGPLEDYPLDKWRELMRMNVESVFIVSKAVVQGMIKRRSGKIINIASVQSELGRQTIAPYNASKGAIKMLTKGMCADWARYNIQVNGIGPGYFKTPLNKALIENPEFSGWLEKRTPTGRWGDVDELQGAAVFLSSAASSFVNGHILYVDGGLSSVV